MFFVEGTIIAGGCLKIVTENWKQKGWKINKMYVNEGKSLKQMRHFILSTHLANKRIKNSGVVGSDLKGGLIMWDAA